ncbi:hypothetical protein CDL12_25846 [Handroanthus impetiginosus]|uniref:Protein transport protein sec16 n=1 Tax=Handroanthus impetiginosus TaxID=429701 RepID=A0A2G9G8V4_9LAMI|nr:hypothetical protein CDL12_25846 [Handroanthus impetiginosus]
MKDNSFGENFNFGAQNAVGCSISVLNLAEVVSYNADASSHGVGVSNYFQALCQQCVPGPLSGGSVGTKELNKWIDERIANPESFDMDYRKAEVLRLLLSLLKIACQYYGKLRSPYGTDAVLKESDAPEAAVARLFASAKRNGSQFTQHGAIAQCLQQMPSQGQMQIIAAHICYLVAEASFEPYSDTARMCLLGADHWKFPRTYASPEAIQRTEIYEYSKTLGNSQFVLLPFQPYKLIYAQMLAEVGRISDALKYCQVVLKSLKTGRTSEVEALRHLVSSLEERIKGHQQGGFSTNLAPKKLVGKLLNLFDSTAHRVVGGLPPPVPTSGGIAQGNENQQSFGPRVSTSQSTMAMSSLVPSQSFEPISEWAADSNRMVMHTRSVSEPDFGRSPRQGHADSLKEASSTGLQDKASVASSTSRFGRFSFGSQLFQKTVGLVLKPRQGRQAKLGETNKFYYDEKLKRWVEEGAEPPAEEAALPPPPPTAVFQNGTSDYNLRSALQNEASHGSGGPESKSPSDLDNNSGIPPLPPTSNQYSARGRMGVRSRYVDTFNKGGGSTANLFQSPSAPSTKPASGANPKFFVPSPVSAVEQAVDTSINNTEDTSSYENPSVSSSEPPSSTTMQRFASMNSISNQETSNNGSFAVHARRTASWGGSLNESFSTPQRAEVKPLGEVLGMHPSSLNGGSFGDDLQEVEL